MISIPTTIKDSSPLQAEIRSMDVKNNFEKVTVFRLQNHLHKNARKISISVCIKC